MTPVALKVRDADLRELMDDPDCDLPTLRRTYAHFRTVNRLVAGWRRVYRRRIRPLLSSDRVTTLLDVGSGGGDVARALARWAASDGLRLEITAVDPDERAHAFASTGPAVPGVRFRAATSADLVDEGSQFDIVISNHLLHHLEDPDLEALVRDCERLARLLVIHNDLERSRYAYVTYAVASRPFRGWSFIHVDGLLSIRRSYRKDELAAQVPPGWGVGRLFPARLLLTLEPALSDSRPATSDAADPARRAPSGTIEP
jgi:2-polyprenyl-3-methyl-5-hydroxy-6-metoxy-1,4-benzoquinol methylase